MKEFRNIFSLIGQFGSYERFILCPGPSVSPFLSANPVICMHYSRLCCQVPSQEKYVLYGEDIQLFSSPHFLKEFSCKPLLHTELLDFFCSLQLYVQKKRTNCLFLFLQNYNPFTMWEKSKKPTEQDNLNHRVPGFLSSHPNWVPPPPHPQASVATPFGSTRGDTRACGRWGQDLGGTQLRRRTLWYPRYTIIPQRSEQKS